MIHQRLKLAVLFVLMVFVNAEKISGCDVPQYDYNERINEGATQLVNYQCEPGASLPGLIQIAEKVALEIFEKIKHLEEKVIKYWISYFIRCSTQEKDQEKAKAIQLIMHKVQENLKLTKKS